MRTTRLDPGQLFVLFMFVLPVVIAMGVVLVLMSAVLAIPVAMGVGVFFWLRYKARQPPAPPPMPVFARPAVDQAQLAPPAHPVYPDAGTFIRSYEQRLRAAWCPELPPAVLLAEMLNVARTVYELEQLDNPLPPVAPANPIERGRYYDQYKRRLENRGDVPATLAAISDACTVALAPFRDALPVEMLTGSADTSSMTVPVIDAVSSVPDVIAGLIYAFAEEEATRATGLFEPIMEQLASNIRAVSPSGTPMPVENYKGTPRQVADAYLGGTPFRSLFDVRVPFVLPDEARFSGHWILSPPGRGKTTLLHAMVMDDILKDGACLILMDSKGDLIDPIRNLRSIEDRLVIIDPDPQHPVAINPLDIAHADITQSVDLLEYLFGSLLEFKMTAMQTTLFRSVLRALVIAFPHPTLETFRDLLQNGYEKYKEHIERLPPDLQDFFYKDFNEKGYADRRREVLQRLRLLLDNDTMRAMLTATRTGFRIGEAMDSGKVVIINNSKARLGDQGAEFFGRFFIAQVLAAAQQRSSRRREQKPPVYFYIDECQNVISRDEKIPTILDECRSQNIALIMAHQRTKQIDSANVLDALSNCAIRFANSDEEARYLAPRLRTSEDFLQSLRRGTFAAFVRDMTPHAVGVSVNRVDFARHPRLDAGEHAAMRDRMRAAYGPNGHADPHNPDEPIVGFNPRPPEMEPWRLDDPPRRRPPRLSSPSNDHPGDGPTEGGTNWQ